jgi:hypothetical protein
MTSKHARYLRTAKGKAAKARYRRSAKGKAAEARYRRQRRSGIGVLRKVRQLVPELARANKRQGMPRIRVLAHEPASRNPPQSAASIRRDRKHYRHSSKGKAAESRPVRPRERTRYRGRAWPGRGVGLMAPTT